MLDESVKPMFPLYEARVEPDIYFFGFDLTAEEARGDDTVDDKPGWFFRIEEVPGDARFGFDISRDAADRSTSGTTWPGPTSRPASPTAAIVKVGDDPAAHAGRARPAATTRSTRSGSSTGSCRSTPSSARPSWPTSRCRRR